VSEEKPIYQNKEWLDLQINVFGKSQGEIAKECGVCQQTISNWDNPNYKEHKKEYDIKYREENKEHRKECGKKYYKENKEHNKEYGKRYYNENKDKIKEHHKKYREENKIQVLEILGGCKCSLCNVTNPDYLTVDHIDETGYIDKKKGYSGHSLRLAVTNDTYPKDKLSNLRVLCWNHNLARRREYLDLPWELQTKNQRYSAKLWKEAFEFFGGCPCGITELKFLTISHIHNDGAERRRNGERNSTALLSNFRQQGWPESLKEDYRLECANCNCSRKGEAIRKSHKLRKA